MSTYENPAHESRSRGRQARKTSDHDGTPAMLTGEPRPADPALGTERTSDFTDIAARFPGAGTLVKGIQLLETIARARSTSTGMLLNATGLPKATFYRLLYALIEFGYVRQDPDTRHCSLGPRFIELGRHALTSLDVREAATHELTRLAERLDETVSLAILDDARVLHIDVRRGRNPLAVGIEVGRGIEAVRSASGIAILSSMPHHEALRRLEGMSTADQHATLTAIAMSRARGYTIVPSRVLEGVTVVAAPVSVPIGAGRAAVTVTALTSRVGPERVHTVGRDVMDAARRVTGQIGSAPMSIVSTPRPTPHVEEGLECVVPAGAIVGEGPVWDAGSGLLRWVDVAAPAFHAFDPATGEATSEPAPYLVSAVLPRSDGGAVAVTQGGLEHYDPGSATLRPLLDPEAHLPGNRLNDAKTDPEGRIWVGSMSLDASMPTGSLYRIENGAARALDGGFQVSNGLGWSPDARTMYFTDSSIGTIFAYDFDVRSGEIAGRRPFARFEPEGGKPDGLAIDEEGHVWVALWDGWRVVRLSPDGEVVRTIDMPVPRPTSCCFGGPDLRTLYVTSASIRLPAEVLDEAPLSGGLFALDAGTAGVPILPASL